MEDIGWDGLSGRFVDLEHRFVRAAFKLYPWEWLAEDEFGGRLLDVIDHGGGTGSTLWIEPAWKMLLSDKALLAVLWELYPGHPNLLPAYLDGPRELAGPDGPATRPSRCSAARAPASGSSGRTAARPGSPTGPATRTATAPRAAATSSTTRCPTSTATARCSAPGWSTARRRASASARRTTARSPTRAPASCRTSSWSRTGRPRINDCDSLTDSLRTHRPPHRALRAIT